MAAVAIIALLAGGPLGVCLAIAYGITSVIRIAKVDSQYAAKGELPPSSRLISKWLDSRAARGAKPEKVKKFGSWAYAWQRWHAMWEDLGETHREVRDAYKRAVKDAKANGHPLPSRPTFKETLTGWKWQIDQIGQPDTESIPARAGDQDASPPARPGVGHQTGDNPSAGKWTVGMAGVNAPFRPSSQGICEKCRQDRPLTTVGWCETCVDTVAHGFCSACDGLMIRDGGIYRHGPGQTCRAVAQVGNEQPRPASKPDPRPKPGSCGGCGGQTMRSTKHGLTFCPVCDAVNSRTVPAGEFCDDCATTIYCQAVRLRSESGSEFDKQVIVRVHALTGTNRCPGQQQIDQLAAMRAQDRPGGDTGVQWRLSADARRRDGETVEQWRQRLEHGPPAGWPNTRTTATPNGAGASTTEGVSMPQPQQSGEVTGIPSAVHYMSEVAAVHTQHAGNEFLITAMGGMNIGPADIGKVQAAQEASRNAAELWTSAATTIQQHNVGVREAYGSAQDAADKHAQMAE